MLDWVCQGLFQAYVKLIKTDIITTCKLTNLNTNLSILESLAQRLPYLDLHFQP